MAPQLHDHAQYSTNLVFNTSTLAWENMTQPLVAAGSVVVSGTITANQGGTWTVQPGNTANTTAWLVDQENTANIDYDTGAGTVNQAVLGIAIPGSGGPVAGGTSTNPIRTDPTGTTTQPVSGTVTANQGGTWTVQPGNTVNTTAWLVSANQGGTWTVQPGNTANTTPWLVSSKTDLSPSSPTFATVGTTSAQAVAASSTRKGLVLINTSDNRISLGFGSAAVLASGITLMPNGGTFVMDEFTFDSGAVNAIAAAASSNLAIQEYT